jgi:hypothetical protein
MKTIKYHTVEIMVETDKIYTLNTEVHDRSLNDLVQAFL